MEFRQNLRIRRLEREIEKLRDQLDGKFNPEREMLNNYLAEERDAAKGSLYRLYDLIERAHDLGWLKSNADRVMEHYQAATGNIYIPPFLRDEADYLESRGSGDNGSHADEDGNDAQDE